MPIECACPRCGQRFRAADTAAGKVAKCPKCGVAIRLPDRAAPAASGASSTPPPAPPTVSKPPTPPPAPPTASKPSTPSPAPAGGPAWFVRTADQKQHGPMDKARLDALVAGGRFDAFCEVRRADWDEWKMIEEVYPSLAIDDGGDGVAPIYDIAPGGRAGSNLDSAPRVRPCPDCGQTVSWRAVQCPHCGCPLAPEVARPPVARLRPSRPAAPASGPARGRRRVVRQVVFLSIAGVLLIVVVVVAVILAVGLLSRPAAPLPVPVAQPTSPAPPAPPVAQGLSAGEIAACKEEVASAAARRVDEYLRTKHEATAQIGDLTRELALLPELAEPRPKQPNAQQPAQPQAGPSGPYQSQFERLHRECLAYLDAHVTEPVYEKKTIWSAGDDWARTQMPEGKLLEDLLRSALPASGAPATEQKTELHQPGGPEPRP